MPLRSFFTALGDIFDATFQILPAIGGPVNALIMITIAGFAGYWFVQMRKQAAAGER